MWPVIAVSSTGSWPLDMSTYGATENTLEPAAAACGPAEALWAFTT